MDTGADGACGPTGRRFTAIYFEATRRCNLRCPMCMTGSNDRKVVAGSRRRELSFDEIRDLVLRPARNLGVKAVGWSGGEFLVRRDALDLVRLTVELGYQCKVCSNGELLTRERLQELRRAAQGKLTIALGLNSLDEDNAETRDADCGRTLEVLALCKELGIDRHVIVTLGKHNTASFRRTVEYLVENRISFNRSPLAGRGSGRERFADAAFARDDLERAFHPALRSSVNGYVSFTPFFVSPELYERASGGLEDGIPHNPPIGCWVGNWITLTAEGDVSVCPVLLDELSAGNVREKPLDELVLSSRLVREITDRSRLGGRCGRCRYQYTCGGCRAMAWYHSGDYLAEDPTCFFEPVDRETRSEHEEETNRWFTKYLIVARHAGVFSRKKPARPAGGGVPA